MDINILIMPTKFTIILDMDPSTYISNTIASPEIVFPIIRTPN